MSAGFAERVVRWQASAGRHGLPWQGTRDPYRIWLSEIMLQQTQVATVVPYYERFVERFPDVRTLAAASDEAVMRLWSGLGYYARARNLLACARAVRDFHDGRFPGTSAALATLPGVGRSTAAAIAAFAYGERAAILDGNVRRVLCRHFAVDGASAATATLRTLWMIAERELPSSGIEAYTQGLMDLGAGVCTRARPRCDACPLRESCAARAQGRVADLPARRRRPTPPTRVRAMLVVRAVDAVLCERQPSPGIWGGLWALPWLDEAGAGPGDGDGSDERSGRAIRDAAARAAASLGIAIDAQAVIVAAPVEHAFTHFRLRAYPAIARIGGRAPAIDDAGGRLRWIGLGDADDEALPKLLKRLFAQWRRESG